MQAGADTLDKILILINNLAIRRENHQLVECEFMMYEQMCRMIEAFCRAHRLQFDEVVRKIEKEGLGPQEESGG